MSGQREETQLRETPLRWRDSLAALRDDRNVKGERKQMFAWIKRLFGRMFPVYTHCRICKVELLPNAPSNEYGDRHGY
jgi:hypothetical protein